MKLTDFQIAYRYGTGVVNVTAKVPHVVHHRLNWKRVTKTGVVASKDGLIFTNGGPFANVTSHGRTGRHVGSTEARGIPHGASPSPRHGWDRTIAISKVDPQKAQLNPIPLGDPESVNIRDTVVTLGRVFSDLQRADGEIGNVLSGQSPTTGAEIVTAMRDHRRLCEAGDGRPPD